MSRSFLQLFLHKGEKCSAHPGKPFTMGCETCMSPDGVSLAVCVECAVTEHKGHDLCTLEEIIAKRQESLRTKLTRGDAISKKIEEILRDIKECEVHNVALANADCQAVRRKAEELKEDIDNTVADFEKHRKSTEKRLVCMYVHSKDAMTSYAGHLRDCLNRSRNQVTSNKVSKLIDAESDLDRTLKQFSVPEIEYPFKMFSPSLRNRDHIKRYLGTFIEEDRSENAHMLRCLGNNNFKRDSPKDSTLTLNSSQPIKFDVLKEVYSFRHSQESIRSLTTLTSDTVWVCRESVKSVFNDLKLVNSEGDIEETVFFSTASGILDVSALDSSSGTVSCKDKTIRRLAPNNKDHEIMFSTDSEPSSICQISKEEFIVCSYEEGEVAKYNIDGSKMNFLARQACAIDDGDGYAEGTLTYTPIITYPYKVRKGGLSDNKGVLAICNHTPSAVVIMDFDLNVVALYHGSRARDVGSPGPETPGFEPMDVCFGANDNIFVADGQRLCVTMLDQKGNFLKDVRVGKFSPTAVVSTDETIWIGYNNGKIEVVKYGSSMEDDWESIEEKFAMLNTLYHPM